MTRTTKRSGLTAIALSAVLALGGCTSSTGTEDPAPAAAETSADTATTSGASSQGASAPSGGSTTASPSATSSGSAAQPSQAGALQVGAAKVDVTPTAAQMPERYSEVLDPLYSRAIAVRSGADTAVLITVDAGGIADELWTQVTTRLETDHGIDPERVMLAATHSHSAGRSNQDGYADKIVQSATEAIAALQPARMGVGTGESHLNVNRNVLDEQTGKWREGPNRNGVSDKTVAVVSFETPSGDPIAVYYNYAMHAVTNGVQDKISADYPGAASTYIEKSLGGDTVAVFSNGAAGDQNPLFFDQTYELRDIRTKAYAARGEDISNALPPGGEGLDRKDPRTALLLDQQVELSRSMGQLLGEEVVSVDRGIGAWDTDGAISGGTSTISCPGRDRTDEGRAGQEGQYTDGEAVKIKLSLLTIGDTYLPGVNGEVFNEIGQRLIAASPHKSTILTTLTNGRANSGYIYNDEASAYQTFEVLSSRLKPGCAEKSIVGGLLDLMAQA